MHIAICEDEKEQASRIKALVAAWASENEIPVETRVFHSAEAFLFAWPEAAFDISILDIQMEGMSGLQLAEHIRKTDSAMSIVFLTGIAQFVLRGYDVGALHYLIKPANPAKLCAVLDKAHALWKARERDAIAVSCGGTEHSISLLSISYFSMASHYAEVHADKGA
jgi:DNA-binding LytR/AlgR family response regulator